jgi:hypothetical protein
VIQIILILSLLALTAAAPMNVPAAKSQTSGYILGLDQAVKTVSIQTKADSVLTISVGAKTQIKREDKNAAFDKMRVGDKVEVSYDNSTLVALSIKAKLELREVKGVILGLDPANNLLSILPSGAAAGMTLSVNNATQITQNGRKAVFGSLVPGSTVTVKYAPISLLASTVEAKLELRDIKGTISALDPVKNSLTVVPYNSNTGLTLYMNGATQITRNGKRATYPDLKIGDTIEAKYVPASGIITTLSAKGSVVAPTAVPTFTQTPVPTAVPPTAVPPTAVPPTAIPPTEVPPTAVPPTEIPPTAIPPTVIPPTATPGTGNGTHASITSYDGPQICVNCHASQADSALHSEHMQWSGKWTQINTYCTAPINSEFACLNCHAGTGKVTNTTTADVDCLICHSKTYQRTLGPKNTPLTITDWQGNTRTLMAPDKINGNYQFQPDFSKMPAGTTMVDLARNVTKPTTATCLRCHAKAGGGNGSKRGDIFAELASPTLDPNVDVHLSPTGAGLSCLSCHKTSNHQIPGKGIDLRVSEGGSVDCTQCHAQTLHGDSKINQHTDRVACQTCHIPKFGKVAGTEMSRDWRIPAWNAAGLDGQGAWVGQEDRQFNVLPTYKFWNGQSYVYSTGQSMTQEPDGSFYEAKASGSIDNGKLYPMKVHTGFQPVQNGTNALVPYDVFWNFLTGNYDDSALRGLNSMGSGGTYTWSTVKTDQLITHGVEPKATSVQCAACHETRTQMDLRALGYTLKDSPANVCSQCHEVEDNPGFYNVHNKHVTDKKIDCSMCHTFTRPERGLNVGVMRDD